MTTCTSDGTWGKVSVTCTGKIELYRIKQNSCNNVLYVQKTEVSKIVLKTFIQHGCIKLITICTKDIDNVAKVFYFD